MKNYLVVLPAYNEARHIGQVIDEIRTTNPQLDIVVINDGSVDDTARVAEEKETYLLNHPVNLGYGAALQTGFRFAAMNGYSHVITMDADGQHDPASIPTLIKLAETEKADVVIGSRFLEYNYPMPFLRRIGSKVFATLARFYTGYNFTDPTSGFQLLNKRAFTYLATSDRYPLDYPDVNIIILLHKKKFKIIEAPVQMRINPDADTMHSGLRPFTYVIRMLLAISLILLSKEE